MFKKKNYCFLHGEEILFDPFRQIRAVKASEFSIVCKHTGKLLNSGVMDLRLIDGLGDEIEKRKTEMSD